MEPPRRVDITPGLAAVVLTGLVLWIAASTSGILLLLFLAVLLAVYLDAFTDAIDSRTRWRRGTCFTAAIVLTLLGLWAVEALLVPPVIEQTRQLADRLPAYVTAWQGWLARLVERFPALEPFLGPDRQQEFVSGALSQAEGLIGALFPRVFDVVHSFINIASVLVMALYLALRPRTYMGFLVALTPPRHRAAAREVLQGMGSTLRAWVLAQLVAMSVLGLLTALGLWLLGVPYWLAFGIFSGLAAIVPFFGTLVSTLLPALFVLAGGGVVKALLVLALGVVVHLIEGNFVGPLVFQRSVHLPPVLTILSVLIAGTLLGPVGLLVAVPLLAVIMVLVQKLLLGRVYGDGRPLPPSATEGSATQ